MLCHLSGQRVRAGDVILIGETAPPARPLHGLRLVYEDEYLLVVNKPAGLLSVATEHERERTAYAYLRADLKERDPGGRLFIVHRLDKFVSGLLAFAKSEAVKNRLQAMFRKHDIERRYWAIVEGRPAHERGTIRSFLAEDRSRRMHSMPASTAGKSAVTHWRVLRRSPKWTALEVTLETGRKNQIRAHMSEMGHPIVGDKAYGSTVDPFGRIALHAFRLGFVHPTRGEPILFESEPPPELRKYLPGSHSS
jgi:23S rRNA pseudouridine1911/1915/1917 synthase